MDYRPLPDDRKTQFRDYVQYAFSPEDGPQDEYERDLDEQPGEERALFDGDEMLCVCVHYWFRTSLRGQRFEMPGLSAVASPPQHRRQGNVARLLGESLAEYRERGDFLTALWAFEHPFYERQGWGLANKWLRYECDPGALSFARDSPLAGGEFRKLDEDDYDRLDPVLAAANEEYELTVERTEDWWRERVFSGWRGDPYVYGWKRDGDLRGYLVYRVEDEDEGKRLHVSEFAAADRAARLNCLRFLANHDSQVETVTVYAPPETALLDEVPDPADLDCEVKAGPMARIVDVPAALEALDYPDDLDAEFTVAVEDPLADWNDDAFRVAVADGRATCERVRDGGDADVAASVSALSQVYVGYHSVGDAETFADLDARTPEARDALAAMLPETEVFLSEAF
ncbi:GNAT family N-acetyltransferase [Halorussus limi]|uniref:GNAT family N-acetyltransferase n=1 Tax=Halorussus limi TaxID=2938695 RepID=A0A8U0HRR2_9EURY|nr:GNAT family N-acetyltransferase [Halorussus limi]UPV73735.1 GNAT family N-acetyltransferase [Halorussus limi]